jgi:hypothetical protein
MREAICGQMKERQELERKVHSQARKADHLERARREEEAPLLQAAYEERLEVHSTFLLPCIPLSIILPGLEHTVGIAALHVLHLIAVNSAWYGNPKIAQVG